MFLFLLTSRVVTIYCCSIVIVTAYTLLLVCVYSPLHCTLLPTVSLVCIGARARHCRVSAQCRAQSGAGPCSALSPGQCPRPESGEPGPSRKTSQDCHQPRPAPATGPGQPSNRPGPPASFLITAFIFYH